MTLGTARTAVPSQACRHWAPRVPLGFKNFPSPQNSTSYYSTLTPSLGPQPGPGEAMGGRRGDSHGSFWCWAEEALGSVRVIRYWLGLFGRWGTLQGPSRNSFVYLRHPPEPPEHSYPLQSCLALVIAPRGGSGFPWGSALFGVHGTSRYVTVSCPPLSSHPSCPELSSSPEVNK